MDDYAQRIAQNGPYATLGVEQPRPQRESACNDANRLVGKLESALSVLDQIYSPPTLDVAQKALATRDLGLLDALERAFHLGNQIDSRLREIADVVGRL